MVAYGSGGGAFPHSLEHGGGRGGAVELDGEQRRETTTVGASVANRAVARTHGREAVAKRLDRDGYW
jgi:hypothetical protein